MQILTLSEDAPGFDPDTFVATELLRVEHAAVRVIRLSPGQALPTHTHGVSDLVLFVVEGEADLGGTDDRVAVGAGSLVHLRGDEELRMANAGDSGLTVLAFLAPAFP
jgi:quercetin dioxygenase-like cupin family protein